MISRRHIRLKVMQSLYAFRSQNERDILKGERDMLKHIENISELQLVIMSFLVSLIKHAESFYEEGKNKHLPTQKDLNPNIKFIDNSFVRIILDNRELIKQSKKISAFWYDNDHDIVRKIFMDILKSDEYGNYLCNSKNNIEIDIKFFNNILNNFILNNKILHHMLEERSIYWIDDLPFVATIIMGNFKLQKIILPKTVFKNNIDKKFALNLFHLTIKNDSEYEKIIIKKAKNWDIERIAIMDQILIKMAFCEILNMPELPINVSLNEYIEISKYYSTNKSKMFVNGLLDSSVSDFKHENKIKKVGRGLM
ncbi:MAG: transcription antitermination protein NusB [Flavobacteriales bacterium]|jgi:transcription antitermination protein NusB|nr:transcription antitermination protein NusB [Flavobacteriales bacterium]